METKDSLNRTSDNSKPSTSERLPEVTSRSTVSADRLLKLGLHAAGTKVADLQSRQRKMALAYEHYRYLTPEKIQAFRQKVWSRPAPSGYRMDVVIERLENYKNVPPVDVLDKLEEAIGRKCFDYFEVLRIDRVKVDPLLLGRINGCQDSFFVAQWDVDVKIEDLLASNEG